MPMLDEIMNLITDIVRVARNPRLSLRLITRDHVTGVRTSDLWFWTRAWQRLERRADDDAKRGRYADFADAGQLVDALRDPAADPVLNALRRASEP